MFVTVGRYAFYVGGGTFNAPYFTDCSDVVDVYDSYTDTWSVIYLPVPLVWHSVTTAGNKLVVAGGQTFDGINWSDQDKIYILDVSGGIGQNKIQKESLRVYPNPSSGILNLDVPRDNTQKSLLVNIYNLQGEMVFTGRLTNGVRKLNLDLLPGIYVLKVVSEDVPYTKLITIQ